ncbi:MAG TPA: FISUMP domain-containing protein [Rhodothermales bacterium]
MSRSILSFALPGSLVSLCALALCGCASNTTIIDTELTHMEPVQPLVDLRDARSYVVVQIGRQVWLARNAAFPTQPSWCYEDQPGDCETNGRLYTWEKAREACPNGWHLPSDDEWIKLERYLGIPDDSLYAEGFRGTDEGARLRTGGDAGFAAPISGYRRPDGSYDRRGKRSAYWTSTEADHRSAWHRDIRSDDGRIYRSSVPKEYALSVRCIRDEKRETLNEKR